MSVPSVDLPIRPPGLLTTWREALTPLEWVKLACNWQELPASSAPVLRNVVLLPGLAASPLSMSAIAAALKRQGHRCFDWGLGRNSKPVPQTLLKVIDRLEEVCDEVGEPVVAIGWSLGGYLAREAARDRPDLLSRLITLGSPVIGGPTYTSAANFYRLRGTKLPELRAIIAERYEIPLEVPVLAIYSKNDGVVAWQACIDEWSPKVRHVEVDVTHLALGTSTKVLRILLEELGTCTEAAPRVAEAS